MEKEPMCPGTEETTKHCHSLSIPRRMKLFGIMMVTAVVGTALILTGGRSDAMFEGMSHLSHDLQFGTIPARSLQQQASLIPPQNTHDGNTCGDNEEELAGLCYVKCSVLTHGTHPFRGSAFTCCRAKKCTPLNMQMGTFFPYPCHGYDVSMSGTEVACPHAAGACLVNEELLLGLCYKKCSILTGGLYPHRIAAATCCKASGAQCMNPFNDKTRPGFMVGGGEGDGNPETPSHVHAPLPHLTESGSG